MGSSTGIKGVYRRGSGYVAQWVDVDGTPQQRRFADKWTAAQWREAVIEGRVPPVRTTLFDQFSADRIALRCTATRYLGSLRVSEAAQPERERLRQQVAKFSA